MSSPAPRSLHLPTQFVWLSSVALCAFLIPLSTTGAWLLLGPAALVVCFMAGSRIDSARYGVVAMLLGAGPAAVVLDFSAHLSVLDCVLNLLTAVVVFVFLPWFIARGRRARREYSAAERDHLMVQARLQERSRIATRMHDELGHDLALLALQASALQVSLPAGSPERQSAADLREHSDQAIERLHEIISMLREDQSPAAVSVQLHDPAQLVAEARAKGQDVVLPGRDLSELSAVDLRVQDAAYRLIREALTNAAKYAASSPIELDLSTNADTLSLSAATASPGKMPGWRPGASGLKNLRALYESLGGSLNIDQSAGRFVVTGLLPLNPSTLEAAPAAQSAVSPRRRGRLTVIIPLAILAAVAAGFFALQQATFNATALTPSVFSQLHEGMSIDQVRSLVSAPGLEAPTPVIVQPPAPADSVCRFFAARTSALDFSAQMYRLCFVDDHLASLELLSPGNR